MTVTKNEILCANKPDNFILAIVTFHGHVGDGHQVHYIRNPFQIQPDFATTSVNFDMAMLLAAGERMR